MTPDPATHESVARREHLEDIRKVRAAEHELVLRERVRAQEAEAALAEADAALGITRAAESPWIEEWRLATGRFDSLPDYGGLLLWARERTLAAEAREYAMQARAEAAEADWQVAHEDALAARASERGAETRRALTELLGALDALAALPGLSGADHRDAEARVDRALTAARVALAPQEREGPHES